MSRWAEVQWTVLQEDSGWEDRDEFDRSSPTPAGPRGKRRIFSLLLTAALTCVLFVSLWTDDSVPEEQIHLQTTPVTSTERQPAPTQHRPDAPQAPLEYWVEKFYQEDILGRVYTKTPLQYWEDRFYEQEAGM